MGSLGSASRYKEGAGEDYGEVTQGIIAATQLLLDMLVAFNCGVLVLELSVEGRPVFSPIPTPQFSTREGLILGRRVFLPHHVEPDYIVQSLLPPSQSLPHAGQ